MSGRHAADELANSRVERTAGYSCLWDLGTRRLVPGVESHQLVNPFVISLRIAACSSVPTDRRISPSVIPCFFLSSAAAYRCEVPLG